MAFVRNRATNLFPLLFGLFLEINGTSSRVLSTLSSAGACVSINTIESLKEILSIDARRHAISLMCGAGSLLFFYIIFDNINLYLKKSQQRLFNQNTMIHATNAAVISLPTAKAAAFDLPAKLERRGKRSQATGPDILPTADDEARMASSFIGITISFILAYSPCSKEWDPRVRKELKEMAEGFMTSDRPLEPCKTDTRPLGVFDVNEGSKKGIIEMLEKLQEVSDLPADEWASTARVIQGDWLTANNIRAARRDRTDDVNSMERLDYPEELSAAWHFALNATHMLMRTHYGNAMLDPGSLAKHKGLLNRVWDASKPDYANAKALIRHSLISRILYTVM